MASVKKKKFYLTVPLNLAHFSRKYMPLKLNNSKKCHSYHPVHWIKIKLTAKLFIFAILGAFFTSFSRCVRLAKTSRSVATENRKSARNYSNTVLTFRISSLKQRNFDRCLHGTIITDVVVERLLDPDPFTAEMESATDTMTVIPHHLKCEISI